MMTLQERVEHLQYLLDEMTTIPPEHTDKLRCLSKAQRRIVAMLLRADGVTVAREALFAAMEPRSHVHDTDCDNTLKAQICYMRRRLREAGVPIEIQTSWGMGYRAVLT